MFKKTFSIMLAGAILLANLSIYSSTTTATECKDVEFIFARGSGEKLGDENYIAWKSSLETKLKSSSLSYNFYELGTRSYDGAKYPAAAIGIENLNTVLTSASAIFSAANVGPFNDSVNQGTTELIGRINSVSSSCSNTKFVLGGYSQGAMSASRSIRKLNPKKIIYLANFGDPNLYLPEGYGIMPPACRGENLSKYRIYAPNCKAHSGLLGANKPYVPDGYTDRIGLWCTKKDIFCSNYLDFTNPIKDHTSYADYGIYNSATETIIQKVFIHYPTKKIVSSASHKKRDIVFLIDTTGSMFSSIDRYRTEALRLASETLKDGGRIALFEYRDLDDPFNPRRLLNFGATYQEFKATIENLTCDGGGDEAESALSAALFAMNNLSWTPGATKSLVLLTDNTYHNPDRDGTALSQVTKRSLEIDPVNFYIVTTDDYKASYTELANLTGGQVFSLRDNLSLSTDAILNRPEINLPLEEYIGQPNETFTFSITNPSEDYIYDWDLDFDGKFEILNAGPTVSKTYHTPGYIQVRATDKASLSSTTSAKITIAKSLPNTPEITSLNISGKIINFTTKNTKATLISADGVILGLTEKNSFTLADSNLVTTLSLTPISNTGEFGETKHLALIKDTPIPLPNTDSSTILAPKSGSH